MGKKRVLSGIQPTGRLHLGNLVGAIYNFKKLQDEYECFYMIADWHSLTSMYNAVDEILDAKLDIVVDWLIAGIDPDKAVIFAQSDVKAHAELYLLFGMLTPIGWLQRIPSYKEKREEFEKEGEKDINTYGFLGYPVLQAADIVLYQAELVPVGVDQLPHIEFTQEIVRRFNNFYGETFIEPKPLLSSFPKLPGIDGRKMSKSYNNAIYLTESPKSLRKKVFSIFTEPSRIRREDKGHPEKCNLFNYHRIFNTEEAAKIEKACKEAQIGCVECKELLYNRLNEVISPFREQHDKLRKDTDFIKDILREGSLKANEVAEKTMEVVRKNIKIYDI
jgi:tryptophanyl-tRNA synthetase